MINTIADSVVKVFSMSWLTGPIFDKELRVSSRRRRNYVLRFAYLGLLTLFLVLFWLEAVKDRGRSTAFQASRMAEAGKGIIAYIVWFQFLTTQLIAIIMLSTSISDEIYHRTLGSLMSTPINSFQIVMGKLFSKLLQIIILLGISLPLLATVRVFGGVPWNYVISSVCITLTAVIFVGSLSLFFSIMSRRAYVVIIMTILTIGMFYGVLPLITALTLEDFLDEKVFFTVFSYVNPFVNLGLNTGEMATARATMTFSWPLHCVIMLVMSSLVLAVSIAMVRKVALLQATGQLDTPQKSRFLKTSKGKTPEEDNGRIRRVKGPAVLWKELRSPVLGKRKILTFIILLLGLIPLFITYYYLAGNDDLNEEGVHVVYACIFMAIGLLFTIILPATSITSEKESRSWPILLATPLTDRNILYGKFLAAVRRCLPIWLLLFGHIIIFSLAGFIHPLAIFLMALVVAGIITLLCGSGIYFSSRFNRTTTAVVMNFSFAALIWAILPLLLTLIVLISESSNDMIGYYCDIIPFVQGYVVMDLTVGGYNSLNGNSYWPSGSMDTTESAALITLIAIGYILIGSLFAWRAKRRFRKNIF